MATEPWMALVWYLGAYLLCSKCSLLLPSMRKIFTRVRSLSSFKMNHFSYIIFITNYILADNYYIHTINKQEWQQQK